MNALLKEMEARDRFQRETRNKLHTTAQSLEGVGDRLRECAVAIEDALQQSRELAVFAGRASVPVACTRTLADVRSAMDQVWRLQLVFQREREALDAL